MKPAIFQRVCLAAMLSGLVAGPLRAAENIFLWKPEPARVTADIKGEDLANLLGEIAGATGWHVFLEPGTTYAASAKFSDLPPGEALRLLLGNLNFALLPATNGAARLFVFRTSQANATLRIRPVVVSKTGRASSQIVPNKVIVRLKPGAKIDDIARLLGAKVTGRIDSLNAYSLEFADQAAANAALEKLKGNSDVTGVENDYYMDPPVVPQLLSDSPAAPLTLKLTATTDGDPCSPIIGLIDTPVQSLGPELDKFMLPAISVAGDSQVSGSVPTHGTAMAYAILTAASQASGGATPAKILPVNVYGSGETTTSFNVAKGLQIAAENHANIMNMSLGGGNDSAVLRDVLQQASAQGIPVFAAAGNQPVKTPTYPAADPGVIAVTATQGGQLAPYANSGSFVDMALPGSSLVYLGGQSFVVQGTSSSTAFASGVAAGTRGQNCLPWAQIRSAMQQKFPVPSQ